METNLKNTKTFIPFGKEWEKECMKNTKETLVGIIKRQGLHVAQLEQELELVKQKKNKF